MTTPMTLLEELFAARLEALAAEQELTEEEKERILAVYRQAAANPFMTDQHIFRKLAGEEG